MLHVYIAPTDEIYLTTYIYWFTIVLSVYVFVCMIPAESAFHCASCSKPHLFPASSPSSTTRYGIYMYIIIFMYIYIHYIMLCMCSCTIYTCTCACSTVSCTLYMYVNEYSLQYYIIQYLFKYMYTCKSIHTMYNAVCYWHVYYALHCVWCIIIIIMTVVCGRFSYTSDGWTPTSRTAWPVCYWSPWYYTTSISPHSHCPCHSCLS